MISAAANDGEPCSGGQSPTSQDFAPIHGGLPELPGPFRDRPDFTLLQKGERSEVLDPRGFRASTDKQIKESRRGLGEISKFL